MIDLDGRTGEGGGQLVRIAVVLAAVTAQPIRITHIRGNRRGHGGLKAQHVSAIEWLAAATGARVQGLAVGSTTLVFRPGDATAGMAGGGVFLKAATPAASTSLMLQAVLPYLLYGPRPHAEEGEEGEEEEPAPVDVELRGGTHVAWAPTFDYLDQVLFPALETWFGIRVAGRQLKTRGWGTGSSGGAGGVVRLTVYPVARGTALRPRRESLWPKRTTRRGHTDGDEDDDDDEKRMPTIVAVDATVLAPSDLHEPLATALAREVEQSPVLSPSSSSSSSSPGGVDLHFRTMEDSGHDSRVYVLLVARTGAAEAHDGDDGDENEEKMEKPGSTEYDPRDTSSTTHHQKSKPVLRWGRDYLSTENFRKRMGRGGGGGGKAGGTAAKPKSHRQGQQKQPSGRRTDAEPAGPLLLSPSAALAAHCDGIARRVVRDLSGEVARGGCGDSFLQDQVVVFQALAQGRTSFWRRPRDNADGDRGEEEDAAGGLVQPLRALDLDGAEDSGEDSCERSEDRKKRCSERSEDREKKDRARGPFGQGSLHAATARWVTTELLGVSWFGDGTVCEGVGWTGGRGKESRASSDARGHDTPSHG